ncbi:hypothetical protein AAG570_013159, partial [Ranatra chinensis]
LQPFWTEDPVLWFIQVEATFATSSVSSQIDQLNLVVRSLDYEVIQRVADTVQFPGDQPYVSTKRAVIEAHSMSRPDRAHQLLGQRTLRDRKPSQFLAHLRHLGGNALPPCHLRALWMRATNR